MMVVAVLMTSCQVSLNPKKGPVAHQTMIVASAIPNVSGCPVRRTLALANRSKKLVCGLPSASCSPLGLCDFAFTLTVYLLESCHGEFCPGGAFFGVKSWHFARSRRSDCHFVRAG